jgi:hypothetical protein
MRIALDWDDTFTRDPDMWVQFIRLALRNKHEIRIVTMRYERELDDVRLFLARNDVPIPVIATGREQKRTFCNQLGWLPHIWIDDCPEFIVEM